MPVWDSEKVVSTCHHYDFPDNLSIVLECFSSTLSQPRLSGCLISCFCRSAKWPTTQLQSWTGIWQWRLRNSLDESPLGPAVPQSPVSSASPGWQIGVSPPYPHRRPSLYLSVLVRPSLPVGHPDLFILFLSSPVPPVCSRSSGMGSPRRISVADRGLVLREFAVTVTLPNA